MIGWTTRKNWDARIIKGLILKRKRQSWRSSYERYRFDSVHMVSKKSLHKSYIQKSTSILASEYNY